MNVIAASVYLCATALAYRLHTDYGMVDVNAVLILQMLGDLLYLFDAYLYYDCWLRDQQEYELHNEREQLIELRLANEFPTDQTKTKTTIDEYDERDRIMDISRNKSWRWERKKYIPLITSQNICEWLSYLSFQVVNRMIR